MLDRPKIVNPQDLIPNVPDDKSKFKVTISFDFEFDWNNNFAGHPYSDYDGWQKLFNSNCDEFRNAIFHLLLNDTAQTMSDNFGYYVPRGKFISCDSGEEIQKIFKDYKGRMAKDKKAADKLKAAEMKKKAKEMMLEAKKLEGTLK
jgi:hypothetical protein